MDAPKPPSGRDIWHAIKSEFEANLYELPSCVLPPSTYFVYLHTTDYAIVEGIVPRIVQESANALTSEVSRRNDEATRRGGRFWRRLQSNPETLLIEVPAGGWKVRIEPDQDGELQRGRVGVLSTLMMPNAPDYSGTPTVRTVRSVFQDGQRTSTSVEVDTASSVRAGAARPGFGAISAVSGRHRRARIHASQAAHQDRPRRDGHVGRRAACLRCPRLARTLLDQPAG